MAAPQVREGFCGTVGHTPLVRLPRLSALTGCDILAKAEHMNPGEDAERRGALRPGGTVIESTAGNTGIGLVLVANAKGYKTKFFVPDSTSSEKINVLRRLGAEVIICPSVSYDNPAHFQTAARLCAEQTENSYFTKQFWNEANYQAHYDTTGPEIWHQTNGKVSAFVCAAGTGGTIGGTSNFLKDKSGGKVKCFLMDPSATGVKYHTEGDKIVLSEKTADEKALDKSSVLEGIGSSKLYLPLSKSRLDGVLTAPDSLAFEMANWLLKHEGISVGPSAALNVLAALWVASGLGRGHTVVTILCDIGSNYYSRDAAWLESKGIAVRPQVSAEQFLAAFNPTRVKVSHVPLAYPHAHP